MSHIATPENIIHCKSLPSGHGRQAFVVLQVDNLLGGLPQSKCSTIST